MKRLILGVTMVGGSMTAFVVAVLTPLVMPLWLSFLFVVIFVAIQLGGITIALYGHLALEKAGRFAKKEEA